MYVCEDKIRQGNVEGVMKYVVCEREKVKSKLVQGRRDIVQV